MGIHTEGVSLPGEPRSAEARSRRTQEAMVGSCPGSPRAPFYRGWEPSSLTLPGSSSLIGHLPMSQGLPQTPIWGEGWGRSGTSGGSMLPIVPKHAD